MDDVINEAYVDDKPHSFGGGNIDYMNLMRKKMLIKLFLKMIHILVLNNIDVQKHFLQYMYIEKENFFNPMLYFLQDVN